MFVLLILGYYTAYIFDPLLDKLVSWRLKRTHAVVLVVVGLVAITTIALLTVVPSLLEDGARLISNLPKYSEIARQELIGLALSLEHRLPAPLATKLHGLAIEDLASLLSGEFIGDMGRGLAAALFKGYSLTLTIVNLLLLPFIVFYLSVSFDDYHTYALSLVPAKYRENVRTIALDIHAHVSAFLQGQLIIGAILSLLYAIGLGAIVRIDYWFLLALISGFGNIVPYLGFLVGIVLSSLLALSTHGSLGPVFTVWAIYAVVQFLEGFAISPRVLGEKVGLAPLTVILSILAFGKLFGLLGIFLAIPIAGIVKVVGANLHRWVLARI